MKFKDIVKVLDFYGYVYPLVSGLKFEQKQPFADVKPSKIDVLKNFAKFTRKYLCWSLFLITVAGLEACNFIKKRFLHRCFPVNIAKFLRTAFL